VRAGYDECVDWLSVVDGRERSVLSVLSVVSVLRGRSSRTEWAECVER
jgi:hypothetical protein